MESTTVWETSDQTLAHWSKVRTFSVTLDANGGAVATKYLSVNTSMRYRHLSTPSLNRYHFEDWYTKAGGGTKVIESTKVTNGVTTLYPYWGICVQLTYLKGESNKSKGSIAFERSAGRKQVRQAIKMERG